MSSEFISKLKITDNTKLFEVSWIKVVYNITDVKEGQTAILTFKFQWWIDILVIQYCEVCVF